MAVAQAEQRARDSDARRILGDELRREEERLVAMKREFNNGEPERRGEQPKQARHRAAATERGDLQQRPVGVLGQ